jgi:hypothetical protein
VAAYSVRRDQQAFLLANQELPVMRFNSLRSAWLISAADTMLLENTIAIGIAPECLGCLPPSLSGAMHVERQKNGDEELFRPPLLVSDLAAVAKLVPLRNLVLFLLGW